MNTVYIKSEGMGMENIPYFKTLVSLWGLDENAWIIIPPLCLITIPIGVFVSLVFTYDFIRYKYWGKQPIGDWGIR